jgi:hypothetical protein
VPFLGRHCNLRIILEQTRFLYSCLTQAGAAAAGAAGALGGRHPRANGTAEGTRAGRAGRKGQGKGAARTAGVATRPPAPADFSRSGLLPRPGAPSRQEGVLHPFSGDTPGLASPALGYPSRGIRS